MVTRHARRWYLRVVIDADKNLSLGRITTIGGLLGIKTAPLVARLTPLIGSWRGALVATIPHRFNAMSITGNVARDTAREVCGPWLDELPGDRIALELGATSTVAHSDEAAIPPGAPDLVRSLGDDLASVGWDGEAWTYALAQHNADDAAVEATIARFDTVAQTLGATEAQRKIASRLHRSLARGQASRAWVRSRAGKLDPILALSWDVVEWLPIQHMMSGFYPAIDTTTKIGRLARAVGIEHCTIELVLGPVDPPGMRILVQLDPAGALAPA
jgi:hypothetical protein